MSASKKLITTVKALSFIAQSEKQALRSKDVAEHLSCNASKLRSLFALLVKSSILRSSQGSNGGFRLNRESDQINLQEIYCAIEDRKAFHMDFKPSLKDELKNYEHYFEQLFHTIQIEIETKFKHITLKDIIEKNEKGQSWTS